MRRAKSLKDARNDDEAASLGRTQLSVCDFWILGDGYEVTLAEQRIGHAPAGKVTIPRRIFNQLIDFYQKDQTKKEK